ncbi:hypothetical protein JCM5353_005561 [Sporobolomyces roseus]
MAFYHSDGRRSDPTILPPYPYGDNNSNPPQQHAHTTNPSHFPPHFSSYPSSHFTPRQDSTTHSSHKSSHEPVPQDIMMAKEWWDDFDNVHRQTFPNGLSSSHFEDSHFSSSPSPDRHQSHYAPIPSQELEYNVAGGGGGEVNPEHYDFDHEMDAIHRHLDLHSPGPGSSLYSHHPASFVQPSRPFVPVSRPTSHAVHSQHGLATNYLRQPLPYQSPHHFLDGPSQDGQQGHPNLSGANHFRNAHLASVAVNPYLSSSFPDAIPSTHHTFPQTFPLNHQLAPMEGGTNGTRQLRPALHRPMTDWSSSRRYQLYMDEKHGLGGW